MIQLPEEFLTQMQGLLGASEYEAFCKSYESPAVRGLRFNKIKTAAYGAGLPFELENSVPWCKEGFTFSGDTRPAKSIFYHTGLFYIQEPSAMTPAEVLGVLPGQRVLDLCAAPGGKSVQIAGYLQGEGLLVANDASPSRSRALVKNLERAGVTNAVVITEQPKKLAERFGNFFDRILVDAPCSGEGMFRRDPDAVKAYTANKPEACRAVQLQILHQAAAMLKPGGRLVYSTCTFNPLENEGTIAAFLDNHKDFTLIPIDHAKLGISQGRPEWTAQGDEYNLQHTARIWPHLSHGEGHFAALMEKVARPSVSLHSTPDIRCAVPKEFTAFCKEHLSNPDMFDAPFVTHGINLYLQPEALDLRGIRVARSGWHLGECAKGRFVPSQALAMGLRKDDAVYSIELSQENTTRYLKGESLNIADCESREPMPSGKPWVLMCYQGFPLGWARLVQGRLKNNLPVGWAVS